MAQAFDMHSLEFRLPDLGEGLTEAEIVRWLVEVGDFVAIDQPVVEVETAKAMVEVPCPYGGVVTARFGEEGMELPVGAPLLTVAVGTASGQAGTGTGSGAEESASGEAASQRPTSTRPDSTRPDSTRPDAARPDSARPTSDEGSGNVLVGYGTAATPARRRRVRPAAAAGSGAVNGAREDLRGAAARTPGAQESAPPGVGTGTPRAAGTAGDVDPTGTTGTAGVADPAGTARAEETEGATGASLRADGPVPVISPLVRKLARDHGLDLRELPGSGPDGLIMRADVEYAMRAATGVQAAPAAPAATGRGAPMAPARPATATGSAGTTEPLGDTRIPLRGVRGAVADKLARSRREIPDATCWVDADATELMAARAAMNAVGGPKISVLALFARICTSALSRYPDLNSRVDMEAREVLRLAGIHLGFAAQTDRGLVVPVVRDAQARDAESLTAEFARLTDAARAGTLSPAELTGGTFTLNNYGVFGVDGSTPIINHPEAAMLGVGRITPKPWVHQGELAVRQVVQLSLTFDHRVCDGGTAGGFLRYVADCVEQPAVLLRTL